MWHGNYSESSEPIRTLYLQSFQLDGNYSCKYEIYKAKLIENEDFMKKYNLHIEKSSSWRRFDFHCVYTFHMVNL